MSDAPCGTDLDSFYAVKADSPPCELCGSRLELRLRREIARLRTQQPEYAPMAAELATYFEGLLSS